MTDSDPTSHGVATPVNAHAIKARDITKSFGGVAALEGVDFELRRGEVHALLGENGAGKTTLTNIFSGIYRADAGEVLVEGRSVDFRTPAQAIAAGVGMVHQHFKLVDTMTVAENLHLGWDATPRIVNRRSLVERTGELVEEFGIPVDPSAQVWQLSVGEQQRVEILRVLARGAHTLILDEPTAVLTGDEADDLFDVVRSLVAAGRSVVFISHKLNEVLAVSDRVTVLRGGVRELTRATEGATTAELARVMTAGAAAAPEIVGVDTVASGAAEASSGRRGRIGDVVLRLSGVCADDDRGLPALVDVDLSVRSGEIVGVAGVSGNGQSELTHVLAGIRPITAGTIEVDDTTISGGSWRTRRPRAIADLGVGHIPEDRIGVGMVGSAPVMDNAVLRSYWTDELSDGVRLRRSRIVEHAARVVELGRVRTRSLSAPAGQMSGGNQQRLVARRESLLARRLLVAAHPTRGLDVQAAREVRDAVEERCGDGCAVLFLSDDLDEVLAVSDRVVVMYEGRIVGDVDARSVSSGDRERLGRMMGGDVAETEEVRA